MAQGLSSGQSSGQFAHLLGIGSPPRMVGKRQQPEQYSAPRPGEDKVFCGNPCAAGIPTKTVYERVAPYWSRHGLTIEPSKGLQPGRNRDLQGSLCQCLRSAAATSTAK